MDVATFQSYMSVNILRIFISFKTKTTLEEPLYDEIKRTHLVGQKNNTVFPSQFMSVLLS